jgi:uncharacterized protein YxjI
MRTPTPYTKELQDAFLKTLDTIQQKLLELEQRLEILENKKDE